MTIGIALLIHFLYSRNHAFWILPTIMFVQMAFPLGLIFGFGALLMTVALYCSVLSRVGGPAAGAMMPKAYFPLCALQGAPFAVPYLIVGILGALLSVYGLRLHRIDYGRRQSETNILERIGVDMHVDHEVEHVEYASIESREI
jgi:hypothetical protein